VERPGSLAFNDEECHMLKSVSHLFERLAERCLALAAGLLASKIEAACIRHEAEQQTQLEELARSFDADGLPEAAAQLRERARLLTHHNPAASGETLLRDLSDSASAEATHQGADDPAGVSLALNAAGMPASSRRSTGRGKRGLPSLTLPVGDAPAQTPLGSLALPPSNATASHEERQ